MTTILISSPTKYHGHIFISERYEIGSYSTFASTSESMFDYNGGYYTKGSYDFYCGNKLSLDDSFNVRSADAINEVEKILDRFFKYSANTEISVEVRPDSGGNFRFNLRNNFSRNDIRQLNSILN